MSFPLDSLSRGSHQTHLGDSVVDNMKQLIINAFAEIGFNVDVVSHVVSPPVVRFEFIPQKGLKIKLIRSCEDKFNEALKDFGPVRLIAPVPGKGTIAVEVPRPDRQIVRLRDVLELKEFQESKAHLPIALGIDSENNTVVADLAKMPQLLIAGATGQGKTTLLNSIILSLLYKLSPVDLKLVLIDPKLVEFDQFNTIKERYLLQTSDMAPGVFIDVEKVTAVIRSLVYEVQHRYDLLRISECRTIYEYNQKIAEGKLSNAQHHHLPYIIVVIDEFADLMITQGRDFESPILQIAQKSRAIGIHLVIATQCLKTDVINGMLKANFPARVAFKVRSEMDSKTILDINGAEQLLGMGDMLFYDGGNTKRIQSCFVDTPEIEFVCDWIAKQKQQDTPYMLSIVSDSGSFYKPTNEDGDFLFVEAARMIVENNLISMNDQNKLKGKICFAELLDTHDIPEDMEYKFPYEEYKIIGDTTEIDKIIYACGYINIDVSDVKSILSKETVNYVTTASAEGVDCITKALKEVLEKLPIKIDNISKLLFNIWTSRSMESPLTEMKFFTKFISNLPEDVDVVWGCAFDESLEGQQAKVSLIAASK